MKFSTLINIKTKIRENGLGRILMSKFTRIGLEPKYAKKLIRFIKIAISPCQYVKRKYYLHKFRGSKLLSCYISEEKGYVSLGQTDIPNTRRVIEILKDIYNEEIKRLHKNSVDIPYKYNLLKNEHLKYYPEITDYALNDKIIQIVTKYLREVPCLRNIQLFYSKINDSSIGSQLFHFDQVDERQVKLLVNVEEVCEDSGPFTFLNASDSKLISKQLKKYSGRFYDEEVFDNIDKRKLIHLTGKSGEGMFVDSSRCLHYGSRSNGKARLMLFIQYTRYHEILESQLDVYKNRVYPLKNDLHHTAIRNMLLSA